MRVETQILEAAVDGAWNLFVDCYYENDIVEHVDDWQSEVVRYVTQTARDLNREITSNVLIDVIGWTHGYYRVIGYARTEPR